MRILLIDGAPFFGGQAKHVCDLALGFREHGHQVAASCNHPDFYRVLREAEIPTVEARFRHGPDIPTVLTLMRALRRMMIEVVHTHGVRAGVTGRIAARLAGCPAIIHTVHTMPEDLLQDDSPLYPLKRSAYGAMDRLLARHTDVIITVSQDLFNRMAALGVPREKLRLIHSGADVSRYESAEDKTAARNSLGVLSGCRVVGTVGRFTRQKNLADLLRAAQTVTSRSPDTVFVLVGDGEEMPALKRLAEELGIAHKVLFPSFRSDLATVLGAFDIFAMSSLWEGHSLAVVEAMAAGLPVIATDVSGVRETVINGVTGWIVPPRDPNTLARAIERVLTDGSAQTMGAAGRDRARALFGLGRMVQQVEDAYRQGLERRSSPATAEVMQ